MSEDAATYYGIPLAGPSTYTTIHTEGRKANLSCRRVGDPDNPLVALSITDDRATVVLFMGASQAETMRGALENCLQLGADVEGDL